VVPDWKLYQCAMRARPSVDAGGAGIARSRKGQAAWCSAHGHVVKVGGAPVCGGLGAITISGPMVMGSPAGTRSNTTS
jgi:hypothetical protein